MTSKFAYFTKLELENVRAFGDRQELSLTCDEDAVVPAQWTLIIGENGVGKTTLLQCLAKMRPVPSQERPKQESSNGNGNTCVDPAFLDELDNEAFDALAREGEDVRLFLQASMSLGRQLNDDRKKEGTTVFTSLTIGRKRGELDVVDADGTLIDDFEEPLVIGYGASRHMGNTNAAQIDLKNASASLFDDALELFDAEELLQQLDYAELKKDKGSGELLKRLTDALATLLPNIGDADNIEIYPPRTPGLKGKKGVYVRTPSGLVPFSSLSLGYQTVTAWTIDIGWRLFQRYPDSPNPLAEPAIVLVDEIDLHLHPRWQRQIRRDLSIHFPNVQFIATAHSPLMAQTYLDANLAVVRLEVRPGDAKVKQATIINDPKVVQEWRLDQVITSELFGFESARPPDVEEKLLRRVELVSKRKRTAAENAELETLDAYAESLEAPSDKVSEILRRAALALEKGTAL